jgi:hypothetical protein
VEHGAIKHQGVMCLKRSDGGKEVKPQTVGGGGGGGCMWLLVLLKNFGNMLCEKFLWG